MTELGNLAVNSVFCRVVLDAVPVPMLVVDDDVRIIGFNAAASALLPKDKEAVLRRRGGDALHCLHTTESLKGCGHGERCKDCMVRNSVTAAYGGQPSSRQKARMELVRDGAIVELDMLVTTAPFTYEGRKLVLLILEDVTEETALRSLLPICAKCKKIRDDQNYWQRLEKYFMAHHSVDFTHGLCPDCARELFPEHAALAERKNA